MPPHAHPGAGKAELREATLRIARSLWDKYYAPVLGQPGNPQLGACSHMINAFLYLFRYPIGFMVAFQSAGKALACASAIQKALLARNGTDEEPVTVRIGLHAGEVIKEGEDFFGRNVIMAARVASQICRIVNPSVGEMGGPLEGDSELRLPRSMQGRIR